MDLILLLVAVGGLWFVNLREQHQRIRLLAEVLGRFQVEKLMETVADGYLRAMGESEPERRQQVWNMVAQAEATLDEQLQRFVQAFDALDPASTRWSTLPLALPFATRWLPRASADFRELLHIHANGIQALVRDHSSLSQRDRAYMLTAELLLLQHSCHWFCRSKPTANARMMARHRTPHAQLLATVSEPTRAAYSRLVG